MKFLYSPRLIFLVVLFNVLHKETLAQNFHLLKDINSSTDAYPGNYDMSFYNFDKSKVFAVLNGISYFSADDGVHGRGLWRSDGTNAGTYQVKDSINPQNIIVVNGKLYFSGNGPVGLWTSDGTEAGTEPIFHEPPTGFATFAPRILTQMNGIIFFTVNGYGYNDQLWKTDGTLGGTVLIKDFFNPSPEKSWSELSDFKAIKNKLFFSAVSNFPVYARKTWVTDGSPGGTHIISNDIFYGGQVTPLSSASSDTLVYFSGSTSPYYTTRSLYITNGDSGNVVPAPGFNGTISNGGANFDLLNIAGNIYFVGTPDNNSQFESLCKYNTKGTPRVEVVKSFPGTNILGHKKSISDLVYVNGEFFFNVYDAPNFKHQLWKSDGTSTGSMLLKDNLYSKIFFYPYQQLYFSTNDSTHGHEVWKSDGTVEGTSMIADINTGTKASDPVVYASVNGKVLFSAQDGLHGVELWQADITTGNVSMVKDINQTITSSAFFSRLISINDSLLVFPITDLQFYYGEKLWKSDGTANGTTTISDTVFHLRAFERALASKNTELYFFGRSVGGKKGFYKMNYITGSPVLVKDFTANWVNISDIIATDSLVYFHLYNSLTRKNEFWRSDGTVENTYVLDSNFISYQRALFFAMGNFLYFVRPDNNSLWKTDGTIAGTILLKNFSSAPQNLSGINGTLFFSGNDGWGNRLWKSDGTSEGTVKVTDNISSPANFISSNGQLFFTGADHARIYGNVGTEFFKTDGTSNGTVLVKDIHEGPALTLVHKSIVVNGTIYFFTNSTTSSYQVELWKSDGSPDGTHFVSTVASSPIELVSSNGKVFFTVANILWETNGTANGTKTVEDNIFSTVTLFSNGSSLATVGDKLFFTANNYQYGTEVYVGNISKEGVVNYITAAHGDWSDPATWQSNSVPPEGASIIIRHHVTGNINTACTAISIEATGNLIVNAGVTLQLLK